MNKLSLHTAIFLVLITLIFWGCKKDETSQNENLSHVSLLPIGVVEASGLSEYKNNTFFTVSDSSSQVYLLNSGGQLLKILDYVGENLEGITYVPNEECIFVVEEKSNEIVKLDTTGLEIDRFAIPLENSDPRHGLEGITYNSNNNHLYIVSEKGPSILFETELSGQILNTYSLSFAEDYSAVYYDVHSDLLWILSDDSKTLSQTTLKGEEIKTYNTALKKGEGLVVDSENRRVYVVTDTEGVLHILTY